MKENCRPIHTLGKNPIYYHVKKLREWNDLGMYGRLITLSQEKYQRNPYHKNTNRQTTN